MNFVNNFSQIYFQSFEVYLNFDLFNNVRTFFYLLTVLISIFTFSSYILPIFLSYFILLFPCTSVWKTLVHESYISYSHTEWYTKTLTSCISSRGTKFELNLSPSLAILLPNFDLIWFVKIKCQCVDTVHIQYYCTKRLHWALFETVCSILHRFIWLVCYYAPVNAAVIKQYNVVL